MHFNIDKINSQFVGIFVTFLHYHLNVVDDLQPSCPEASSDLPPELNINTDCSDNNVTFNPAWSKRAHSRPESG